MKMPGAREDQTLTHVVTRSLRLRAPASPHASPVTTPTESGCFQSMKCQSSVSHQKFREVSMSEAPGATVAPYAPIPVAVRFSLETLTKN